MDEELGAELRAQWKAWAAAALGGTPEQMESAVQAALAAIGGGASPEEAADIARSAWQSETARPTPELAIDQTVSEHSRNDAPESRSQTARSRPGRLRGRVAGFQQRNELHGGRYLTVWNFRIDPEIDHDTGVAPTSVEMRGFQFEGAIANGDEVEITGNRKPGHVQHVKRVENLTSNSVVRVQKGPPHGAVRVLGGGIKLILILALIAVAIVIFIVWVSTPTGP